jgi:hypothetical protein
MEPQWRNVDIPVEVQNHAQLQLLSPDVRSSSIADYMTDDHRHNSAVTLIICQQLWPDQEWCIYCGVHHSLVSDGSMVQLINYLHHAKFEQEFYICDPTNVGRKRLKERMMNDAGGWRMYITMDEFLS